MGSTVLIAVVAVVASTGCGVFATGSDEEQAIEWSIWAVTGKREVRIVGQEGYCEGRPKPRITDVITQYEGERVYMTAMLREPPESSAEKDELCLGVELAIYKTVKLDRPVKDSVLYDASLDPPEQRWPD